MPKEQSFRAQQYEKGELIMREGDYSDFLVFIQQGSVDVIKMVGEKGVRVATLKAGEIIGEMAAMTGDPRNATVVAAEKTSVILIGERTLKLAMINDKLPVLKDIMLQLVHRFKECERRNMELLKEIEKLKQSGERIISGD